MSDDCSFDHVERRCGVDRRIFAYTGHIPERRSGRDRRSGNDRRTLDRTGFLDPSPFSGSSSSNSKTS
ncbi:MAG: hypothetical protein C4519_25065 [Desulfobacteraceae bacterium]|nr:MAG: hypothetical protein C4519_25065 [Desulfobacteraceae bacterium]